MTVTNQGLTVRVAVALLGTAAAGAQPVVPGFADALLGRWDLTVAAPGGAYPSWLEVSLRTETELMGRFVGRFGSVRYVSDLRYADGRFELAVPVQYERGADVLRFEGMVRGDRLEGTTLTPEGVSVSFAGVRAPSLAPSAEIEWGEAVALFNGRNLDGWRLRSDTRADCWGVAEGLLRVTPPCVDLVSEAQFRDFRLHAELRFPAGSNSGIYLRGRYEVQIQDDAGKALDPLRMGGVYGFIAPTVDAARPAGEWQTLDVELRGRYVSVQLNGKEIIAGQQIPGITGGALDSDERAPGPVLLQGDHGPIEFRVVTVAPAR